MTTSTAILRRRVSRAAVLLFAASLATQLAAAETSDAPTPGAAKAPAPVAAKPVPSRQEVEAQARASAETPGANDVVQISPFEVNGSDDQGYQATSATSGTRLNSKIEDIAASLSVVTKQQMQDTASVDINDVFLYEANTEGTAQWTSFSVDRGTVSDDIQANPTGATRMRGLTSANTAMDGFTSALPFDSYNVDSLEISRGPNSTVFGLGNSGGGVNANLAKANLTRHLTSFTTRGDSFGGYRGSFDVNRPIIKDKLAVRVLGLYEAKGYEQEPAYDKTRRAYFAATARPFRNTTIKASFESYREAYNRPNSATPRDGISDWIANGKPVYNPLTRSVRFLDGKTAPINNIVTLAQENALLPYSIAPTNTVFTQSPSMYIVNGQIVRNEINAMPTATGTGPTSVDATAALPGLHLLTSNTFYNRNSAQYPLFLTPGITDKSIYNWEDINITAPNYGARKGEVANVSLEQVFLNTPRHTLVMQAAWQKETVADNNRSFLGSYGNNGGKLEVDIDINEYLLDGTPNPFFLQPYLGYPRPGFSKSTATSDKFRGQLAYQLNLTREKGWLKYLGHHSFSAYGEYQSIRTYKPGYTDTISSDEQWMGTNGISASRNANGYRPYVHYILGDNQGYNVDFGAKGIKAPPYSTTLRYYNGVTQQWINEPVDYAEYYYANRPIRRLLGTAGATWQGFFWNDRIVPTFGYRRDSNRQREANSAINPTAATDGFYVLPTPAVYSANDWVHNSGATNSKGVVVKALRSVHLLYNQSNSFTPGSLAYTINGEPLNDPQGETKDYGFQFILLNNRLTIRAQQYETLDSGRGDSTVNTYIQRTLRMDGGPSVPAGFPSASADPNLTSWYANELALKNPTMSVDQVLAQTIKDVGVDPVFIASHYGKTHGDNSKQASRGKEVEISYNPTNFWTLKATITQQKAFNGKLAAGVQEYINARLPLWTTIRGPSSGQLWWTNTQNSSTTPQTFYTANVLAPLSLIVATQGKLKAQTREYRFNTLTNVRLSGLTDNKYLKNLSVGGAVRWESKAVVGYYGGPPEADGVVRTYDANRPIWDKARYYFDFNAAYNLRLLDKVRARIQLNVRNAFEDGRLQSVAYNPDGAAYAFRMVDPRQFILSATFDL